MAKRLLMGNEAFAHAALEAGVNVVAGYPGTPSSEVIETVARLHKSGKAEDVYVEWSCNEKAALEVAAAASMSGARALFTCKQVGLNVASDALMSLNYVGVRGGLVLFVADDPGPISSQTEQDTRRFAAFAKVPVLDPATPEQGFQMMKEAFELSERYKTPVIVRPTTRIDHASTFFEIEPHTVARPIPDGGFERDPSEWVIFPKRSYRAHGEINQRLNSIAYDFTYDTNLNRFNNGFDKVSGMPARPLPDLSTELGANAGRVELYAADYTGERPKLGIVCGGVSRQYALEAIEIIEREAEAAGAVVPSYRFLQIGTPYPFPSRIARRFLKDLSDVIVFEELDSVIEEELLKVSGVSFLSPNIHGKLTKEAADRGENTTEDMAYRIAAFFDKYNKSNIRSAQDNEARENTLVQLVDRVLGAKALLSYGGNLPMRAPVLCAGCPHRGSFYAMKRAVKKLKIAREDAVFCGDIGCYTLGNAMPLDACDTCLCMGGGITMAQGFSATNPEKKSIAFVGDSTFFASAMTGIANAVYNRHDITICVLDNSTTAMTGSQPHPGTGVTLMDAQSEPIDIAGVLTAFGVKSIIEVNPLDEAAAESACIESLLEEEPTAIIFKSPCVWLQPFGSPAKVHVNACTGCKKCITEIGCPAIRFNKQAKGAKSKDRGQAVIDESQCNGCGLCLQVCPFHAIEILTPEEKELFESARRASVSDAAAPGSVSFGVSEAAGEGGAAGAGGADAGAGGATAGDQHAYMGSDEMNPEDVAEPQEDDAEYTLEIEDAFELDSGGLNLAEMYGTGSLEKIAKAEAPRVSRATSNEIYSDSFTDATVGLDVSSSRNGRGRTDANLSDDAIRVGSGVARPVNRKNRYRKENDIHESASADDRHSNDRRSGNRRSGSYSKETPRRASKEAMPKVEQVKIDELDDNFDGLVGNLVDSISDDSFEEYSTAAAAYSAAKDAVSREKGEAAKSHTADNHSESIALASSVTDSRNTTSFDGSGGSDKPDGSSSDSGVSSPKHYYMKNTSYRRKAITYAFGQTAPIGAPTSVSPKYTDEGFSRNDHMTGEIDLTRDAPATGQDATAGRGKASSDNTQDEDALDVLDALNTSIYIEVDDGEEARIAAEEARAERRAAREAAERRAAEREAERRAERERLARKEAARSDARDPFAKSGSSAGSAKPSGKNGSQNVMQAESHTGSQAHTNTNAAANADTDVDTAIDSQDEPIKPSAVMSRAEREKLRAQYAQYVHYSPTQYASGGDRSDSKSDNDSGDEADKPSVRQSRWGGRG